MIKLQEKIVIFNIKLLKSLKKELRVKLQKKRGCPKSLCETLCILRVTLWYSLKILLHSSDSYPEHKEDAKLRKEK